MYNNRPYFFRVISAMDIKEDQKVLHIDARSRPYMKQDSFEYNTTINCLEGQEYFETRATRGGYGAPLEEDPTDRRFDPELADPFAWKCERCVLGGDCISRRDFDAEDFENERTFPKIAPWWEIKALFGYWRFNVPPATT